MAEARLARGGAFGFAAVVLERGIALATLVVLGRLLAPEAFGRWAFVVAYLSLFQVVADLGIEAVLLRRLVQSPGDRGRILAGALGLRVALAVAAGAAAVALAPLAGAPGADARTSVACGAAALLFVAQPGLRALLRAELRMGRLVAVAAVSGGLTLAGTAAVARAGGGVATVFVAAAVAQAAAFALAAWLVRDRVRLRLAIVPGLWRDLARESWPIAANVLAAIVGLRIGAMLLVRDRGAVEVGYFTSAFRLAESLNVLAEGAMLSAFPLLAAFVHARRDAFVAVSRLVAKNLAIALLIAILAVTELAPDLLGLLFRPEFAIAAPSLVVLAWGALLFGLGTLYTGLIVAVGEQQTLFRLNLLAMVLQIALQAALVPRLGILGAATAAVAGSVASHTALAFLPATRDLVRPCLAAAAAPVAAAVAIALGVSLLDQPAPIRAAIALAAFVAVVLGGGIASREDLRSLRALGRLHADLARPSDAGGQLPPDPSSR
jgi:O-antigen/teichoic acid export membrane protein